MWIMMKYEFKKMFHSPLQKILPILLIMLPLLMVTITGKNSSTEINEKRAFYHSIHGEMNASWYDNLKMKYTVDEETGMPKEKTMVAKESFELVSYTSDVIDQSWNQFSNKKKYSFLSKEMNQATFIFGDYLPWDHLIQMLDLFSILYLVYLTFTLTTMFSNESQVHMLEQIKTTKIGKWKVGIAKIACSLLLTIALPLVAYLMYYAYIALTMGLTDPNITMAVYHTMTPYTFGDALIQGCILKLLGGIVVCMTSLLISILFKSSHKSMAVSFLILLLPMILPRTISNFLQGFEVTKIFPINFTGIQQAFMNPFIFLNDTSMYCFQFIIMLWVPFTILLLLLNALLYRKRTI